MSINIKITELSTPPLEFGSPGEFFIPKIGLLEAGPFDSRFGGAKRTQIALGIVGTKPSLDKANAWIAKCSNYISSGSKLIQNPDYPGFYDIFKARINTNEIWTKEINEVELSKLLEITDSNKRFEAVLDLYDRAIGILSNSSLKPDVVLCALTDETLSRCWSVARTVTKEERIAADTLKKSRITGQLSLFDSEVSETAEDLLNRDFRRALKARSMKFRMPIQIGTDGLFMDSLSNQDPATRAWNFSVALYYKSGGIPWRLKNNGPETCFVGISFHHLKTTKRHLVHSSIAQAFSTKGDGFAIKGESIPYDPRQGKNVHLTYDQSFSLGKNIIDNYREHTGTLPLRMVLHKTSKFSIDEEAGFKDAFQEIAVVELVNLMNTSFRLTTIGNYPPRRGTFCDVNNKYYLFTTGFMPELNTYPGPHIPTPAQINATEEIDIQRACEEILGLTRMNWNTASISGGQPVTFFFSRNVGGIIAEFGDTSGPLPTSFKFFM